MNLIQVKLNFSFVKTNLADVTFELIIMNLKHVTLGSEFDSNEYQFVHFEIDIATCETQIVTFAVQFVNVENQFAIFWYDIVVFLSSMFVQPFTRVF